MDLWLDIQINQRKENNILLEASHSKVTKEVVDDWFEKYRAFLLERNLLYKPRKMHNADETGFTIGSKTGVFVGPTRQRCTDHIYQTGQQNNSCK